MYDNSLNKLTSVVRNRRGEVNLNK
jgi:hypothetical protein